MAANYSTCHLNKEASLGIKYVYSIASWVGDGESKLQRAVANWMAQAVILSITVFSIYVPTKQR